MSDEPDDGQEDLLQEKWFVLNMLPGGANITENPKHECFDTERAAIAYAKDCARSPDTADDEATYHIMRTVAVVSAQRRVSVKMVKPNRKAR